MARRQPPKESAGVATALADPPADAQAVATLEAEGDTASPVADPPAAEPPAEPPAPVVPTEPPAARAVTWRANIENWSEGEERRSLVILAVALPFAPFPAPVDVAVEVVDLTRAATDTMPELVEYRKTKARSDAAARAVEQASIALGQLRLERRWLLNLPTPGAEDLLRLDQLRQEIDVADAQLTVLRRAAAEYQQGASALYASAQQSLRKLGEEKAWEVRLRVDAAQAAALQRAAEAAGPDLAEYLRLRRVRTALQGGFEHLIAALLPAAEGQESAGA